MIPLDRIVLGTAKFGMPWYGYGSTSRPTAYDSIAIIQAARKAGIRRFDTALGYGDAVEFLEYASVPRHEIIIKARLPFEEWDMVHNPSLDELAGVAPMGCGASVYTLAEVAEARRLGIGPIQAPGSCLNPAVDVEYGRAPFLQGVLLRSPSLAPAPLCSAVWHFQDMAKHYAMSAVALALASAYGEKIVVGVSSVRQLDELIAACDVDVPADAIERARALGQTVDATAALPSLWSTP